MRRQAIVEMQAVESRRFLSAAVATTAAGILDDPTIQEVSHGSQ